MTLVPQLIAAADCSDDEVLTAAQALHAQWPRGGSISDYIEKLRCRPLDPETSQPVLPCSYLLVNDDQGVIGHGRLTECFEGAGGRATAATYVLITRELRFRGFGSQLMTHLEQKSVDLGYHYLYLWTTTAIPFYINIGYRRTERVSLFSACLKSLQCDQVSSLEAMLSKRHANLGSTTQKQRETVMLPPCDVTDNDVWLRKRLVETIAAVSVPREERIDELKAAICKHSQQLHWEYFFHSIPWQQQVGPSCGLVALRMLRDHYSTSGGGKETVSLLTEAQAKGYTVDGEIFDARNLVSLAHFCGLEAELWSFGASSPTLLLETLQAGGTAIVPYDSQPSTKRPCQNSGRTAHYGIIAGMLVGHLNVPGTVSLSDEMCRPVANAEAVFLLVQHGLSPKWTIASWSEFFDSNQQLITMDEKKYHLLDRSTLWLHDCLLACRGRVAQAPNDQTCW